MQNIMLTANFKQIKIVDFGLGNWCDPSTLLRTNCGSPEYAAPELYRPGRGYGPQVDLWSLGVVIYVMVTGFLPFVVQDSKSLTSVEKRERLLKQIQKGFQPHHQMAMFHVSQDCQQVVSRLLTVSDKERIEMQELMFHPWVTRRFTCLLEDRSYKKLSEGEYYKIINRIAQVTNSGHDEVLKVIKSQRTGEIGGMFNILLLRQYQRENNYEFPTRGDGETRHSSSASTSRKQSQTKLTSRGRAEENTPAWVARLSSQTTGASAENRHARKNLQPLHNKPRPKTGTSPRKTKMLRSKAPLTSRVNDKSSTSSSDSNPESKLRFPRQTRKSLRAYRSRLSNNSQISRPQTTTPLLKSSKIDVEKAKQSTRNVKQTTPSNSRGSPVATSSKKVDMTEQKAQLSHKIDKNSPLYTNWFCNQLKHSYQPSTAFFSDSNKKTEEIARLCRSASKCAQSKPSNDNTLLYNTPKTARLGSREDEADKNQFKQSNIMRLRRKDSLDLTRTGSPARDEMTLSRNEKNKLLAQNKISTTKLQPNKTNFSYSSLKINLKAQTLKTGQKNIFIYENADSCENVRQTNKSQSKLLYQIIPSKSYESQKLKSTKECLSKVHKHDQVPSSIVGQREDIKNNRRKEDQSTRPKTCNTVTVTKHSSSRPSSGKLYTSIPPQKSGPKSKQPDVFQVMSVKNELSSIRPSPRVPRIPPVGQFRSDKEVPTFEPKKTTTEKQPQCQIQEQVKEKLSSTNSRTNVTQFKNIAILNKHSSIELTTQKISYPHQNVDSKDHYKPSWLTIQRCREDRNIHTQYSQDLKYLSRRESGPLHQQSVSSIGYIEALARAFTPPLARKKKLLLRIPRNNLSTGHIPTSLNTVRSQTARAKTSLPNQTKDFVKHVELNEKHKVDGVTGRNNQNLSVNKVKKTVRDKSKQIDDVRASIPSQYSTSNNEYFGKTLKTSTKSLNELRNLQSTLKCSKSPSTNRMKIAWPKPNTPRYIMLNPGEITSRNRDTRRTPMGDCVYSDDSDEISM